MRVRLVGLIIGLAAIAASPAKAAPILLTFENPGVDSYQQTTNRPCVIGEPSCSNLNTFDYGLIPSGDINSYSVYSDANDSTKDVDEAYTVSQITSVLNTNTFYIGIDVNTASGQPIEQLLNFQVLINGSLAYYYNGPTSFALTNNGNGYSDALLKTVSLAGLNATDTVQFFASVDMTTDGREQFFLIGTNAVPDTPPVPEPGSLLLLGSGLIGLGYSARRRFKRH